MKFVARLAVACLFAWPLVAVMAQQAPATLALKVEWLRPANQDELGFADLMPGSGHGQGGYIQLGGIEVNGKTVPR
jgi:hypothetical protein